MNRRTAPPWRVRTIPTEGIFKVGRNSIHEIDEVPAHSQATVKERIIAAMQEHVDPKKGIPVTVNEIHGYRCFKVPMLITSKLVGSIVLLTLDRNDGAGPKPIIARVLEDQIVEIIEE